MELKSWNGMEEQSYFQRSHSCRNRSLLRAQTYQSERKYRESEDDSLPFGPSGMVIIFVGARNNNGHNYFSMPYWIEQLFPKPLKKLDFVHFVLENDKLLAYML